MSVARNVIFNPCLLPGGGATEMAISIALQAKAWSVPGVQGLPFRGNSIRVRESRKIKMW